MNNKPQAGQCRTCEHYEAKHTNQNGYCKDIRDYVFAYWTGCVRWTKRKETT